MRNAQSFVSRAIGHGCLLFALLAAAGCSSSPGGSHEATLGEQALQGLTPLGRTILADKVVTPGEYELAVQDTVSCLRTAGFTVSNPAQDPDGTWKYMASYSAPEMATAAPSEPPPDSTGADAKHAACEKRKAAPEAVYVLQHSATEEEARAAFGVLITCAEEHGVKVSVSKDSNDFGKVNDEITAAKRSGLITDTQADSCINAFSSKTLRPLPGLSEALAQYKG